MTSHTERCFYLFGRIDRNIGATVQGRLYKTRPVRRCIFPSKKDLLMTQVLGAATRQACDLEGVGAGTRQC